jgi:hypothetical protein
MSQPFFGTTQLRLDVLHFKTTTIFEFDTLEQIPDAFLRVEFWSVCRQWFQMNPSGTAFAKIGFDLLATMKRGSVPDHEQLARNLAREQLQKTNDSRPFVGAILPVPDDLSLSGEATHHGKVITRQLHFQDGCLTDRCVGSHAHGQQRKSRLIDQD